MSYPILSRSTLPSLQTSPSPLLLSWSSGRRHGAIIVVVFVVMAIVVTILIPEHHHLGAPALSGA
eukprot:8448573-Karenia_brevis.AAC.1